MEEVFKIPMGMIRGRNGSVFAAVAAVVMLVASAAFAQTETGRITGIVTRNGGGPVAKVEIVAKSTENGLVRKTTTNDKGIYNLSNIKPGVYEITVEGAEAKRVRVSVGTPVKVNLEVEGDAQNAHGK